MRFIISYFTIFVTFQAMAQSVNSARRENKDTHLMGSGAKNAQGMGINKDNTKYKKTESMTREELQEEEIGNNPTSTDAIQGKNSKKVRD